MFARTVRMHLKPNSVTQFTETMEKDVRPPSANETSTIVPRNPSGGAARAFRQCDGEPRGLSRATCERCRVFWTPLQGTTPPVDEAPRQVRVTETSEPL